MTRSASPMHITGSRSLRSREPVIAEQALRERLNERDDAGRQDVVRFCRENGQVKNCHKLAYRLQRLEINRIAVDTVLHSLPEEKRELMIRKYHKNEMLVKISMALNVSIGQLCLWDRAILGEIRDMLMYRLTERDIFNRLYDELLRNSLHITDAKRPALRFAKRL